MSLSRILNDEPAVRSPVVPAHVAAPAPARPFDPAFSEGPRRSPPLSSSYAQSRGHIQREYEDRTPSPPYHHTRDDEPRRMSQSPPRWIRSSGRHSPPKRSSPGSSRGPTTDEVPPHMHMQEQPYDGDYDSSAIYPPRGYRETWDNGGIDREEPLEVFYSNERDQQTSGRGPGRRPRGSSTTEDVLENPGKRKRKGNEDTDYQPARRVRVATKEVTLADRVFYFSMLLEDIRREQNNTAQIPRMSICPRQAHPKKSSDSHLPILTTARRFGGQIKRNISSRTRRNTNWSRIGSRPTALCVSLIF